MKKSTLFNIQSFFQIFILSFLSSTALAQVSFVDDTFENIVSQAKAQEKLVFVDAYTDWCSWCKVMDKETFSDAKVGDYVNKNFIATKVNMEEGFGLNLAMKYRVSYYPQYLLFDGNGQLVGRVGGYLEKAPFIKTLKEAVLPENHLAQLEAPMDFEMDYPAFYKNSFKKRAERSYPSKEEVQDFLTARPNLTDEVSWAVMSRFVTDGLYAKKIVEYKDVLIEKYGRDEVIDKLATFVFADVKTAIKDSSEYELTAALNKADELLGEDSPAYKLRYRLYFYQMTRNWDAYAQMGVEISKSKEFYNGSSLNQIAWSLFENDQNIDNLKLAAAWMSDLTAIENTYVYLDTEASILYKLQSYSEALAVAKKALAAAEIEEQDSKGTEELLEKINASI